MDSLEIGVSSATHIIEVVWSPSGNVTGATWLTPIDHDPDETIIQSSVTGSIPTDGIVIYQDIVTSTTGRSLTFDNQKLSFDLPETGSVTLVAKSVAGAGSVNNALLRFKEEW